MGQLEENGLLTDFELHRNHCHNRGEEGRQVCDSGRLPNQDSNKTGHKGWQEDDIWQGGSCQGQASKDNCEGIPCGCPQAKHLSLSKLFLSCPHSGNPTEVGQVVICCVLVHDMMLCKAIKE